MSFGHTRVVWAGNDGAAVIEFDETGRLANSAWVSGYLSFFDIVRGWLRI
jgi:hypothetical protein